MEFGKSRNKFHPMVVWIIAFLGLIGLVALTVFGEMSFALPIWGIF